MAKPVDPDSPLNVSDVSSLPEKAPGEKLVAITLRGVGQTEDGRVVKTDRKNLLNILSTTQDDYSDIVLTPEESVMLAGQMRSMTSGMSSSVPVICQGNQCPWKSRCTYFQIGKAPVGRQCLIELNIIKQAQFDYMSEYDVTIENRTEIGMIQELAEIEVFLHRANLNMALSLEESRGVVDAPIGFDHEGNVITQKQVSMNIELREKLLERRRKLTKLMVGDRQEKYKREAALKVREQQDPSSRMAEIREKLNNLQHKIGMIADANLDTKQITIKSEDQPLSPDDIMSGMGSD